MVSMNSKTWYKVLNLNLFLSYVSLFILMVSGIVKCCCGVGSGICWIAIGVWGVLFLGVLGMLMKTGHKGNIGLHYKDSEDPTKMDSKYGNICLVTVFIYIAIIIFCSFNIWYRKSHPWKDEEDNATVAQFSAIGPNSSINSVVSNK